MFYEDQFITDTLKENYMPYAMSVIISRAIPEIDGFKPSHRKLLYTMYKMNLINGNRTKSSNVVGQTMKLNPHGDMAIYETMVRLTKSNESLLHPFVDSKGNFAKHYSRDMAFAAPRYTEVKLEGICKELFGDIDKNTVDFVDNYDGTMKEPVLLPVSFPNILVNPNEGIAVGMASKICSFNLREVCETTIAYLKNEKCDIMKTLLAPDFTTGGQLLYDEEAIRQIYEIPYSTTSEAIIDKIIELIKLGKIKEINDLRDETDLSGLKITLDVKKSCDADLLMKKLFKMTPLEDTFSCNFNILDGTTPKVMGVKEILHNWSEFRKECITRKIKYDINKLTHKLHLLEGLKKILLDIDKAIKIIRNTERDDDVVPNLMKGFDIDEIQANYIAEIKLRSLNKEYIINRINDIDDLNKEIDRLDNILRDEKEVKKVIINELKDIAKKYGKDRLTEIIYDHEDEVINTEPEIEDYNLKIIFTRDNYLKKISHVSLRSSGEQKLKEGDEIVCEYDTTNKTDLLLFSDRCNCYKIKTYDVPQCKASEWGQFVPNICEMEKDERIVFALPTNDYSGDLLFMYDNGKGAKVSLKAYETKTNRKKLINAYNEKQKLVSIKYLAQDEDVVVYSSLDKILIFNTSCMQTKTTKNTMGVAVMNMKKKSTIAKIEFLRDVQFTNPDYYKAKNIPATGYYLKDDDNPDEQISLF